MLTILGIMYIMVSLYMDTFLTKEVESCIYYAIIGSSFILADISLKMKG